MGQDRATKARTSELFSPSEIHTQLLQLVQTCGTLSAPELLFLLTDTDVDPSSLDDALQTLCDQGLLRVVRTQPPVRYGLQSLEETVLRALQHGELSTPELLHCTSLDASELQNALQNLLTRHAITISRHVPITRYAALPAAPPQTTTTPSTPPPTPPTPPADPPTLTLLSPSQTTPEEEPESTDEDNTEDSTVWAQVRIEQFDPPDLIKPSLERLHITHAEQLLDLNLETLEQTRGIGRKKRDAILEFKDRVRDNLSVQQPQAPPLPPPLKTQLLQRGLVLCDPWENWLVRAPRRALNALYDNGIETVEDLLHTVEHTGLSNIPGMGQKTSKEIEEQLATIAQYGQDAYVFKGERPETLPDMLDVFMRELDQDEKDLIHNRLVERMTLRELGDLNGVTRENIRQRLRKVYTTLAHLFRRPLKRMFTPLLETLDRSGGLLFRDTLLRWSPDNPTRLLRRIPLISKILQIDVDVWGEHFVKRDDLDMDALGQSLRKQLQERSRLTLTIQDLRSITLERGFRLDRKALPHLTQQLWGLDFDPDGRMDIPWLNRPKILAGLLRHAQTAVNLDEATELFEEYASKNDIEFEPGSTHLIQPHLKKHPEIITCGYGQYIHIDTLNFDPELVQTVVEQSLALFRGRDVPVSTRYLLRTIKEQGTTVPNTLNIYVLHSLLAHQPHVKVFRGSQQLAWEPTFHESGLTLVDRAVDILRTANTPLCVDDINAQMPDGLEYSPQAIYTMMLEADDVLSIGRTQFFHVDNLGMTPLEREELIQTALQHIPNDGVIQSEVLLEHLLPSPLGSRLSSFNNAPQLLWGLLRNDDRVQAGGCLLLARRSNDTETLSARLVLAFFEEHGVATRNELAQSLFDDYRFAGSTPTINRHVNNMIESGTLVAFSDELIALSTCPKERILARLEHHNPDQ